MGVYFNTWTCGDLTPEQEAKYKKFFEDNGIKNRQGVAEYYEKRSPTVMHVVSGGSSATETVSL